MTSREISNFAIASVLALATLGVPLASEAACKSSQFADGASQVSRLERILAGGSPAGAHIWKVIGMFKKKRFADLDAMELASRDLDERLADGLTVRAAFFIGISNREPFLRADCMPTDYADEEAIRAHQEFAEFAAAWLRQNPSSRAARLLVPAVKADLAFVQRGSGYAHEVPPGAWKEIARIVKEATKELDAMAPEEKRDPIWHLIRLNLLLVEPRDPPAMEKMIAAAIDSAPEMPQVYFRASDLYDPSYGGSYRQIALFAERTLKRPSKEGSHALYARIQWSNKSKDMFTNGQADWSLMRKGFEQIVERYPHSWNINSFGWFACLAKDKEATLRLTDLSLNPPNSLMEKAWGSNIFFFRCRSWAADAGPWYAP